MEEKPRLRGLEAFPIEQNGKKMVALRDPLGILPRAVAVSPEFFWLASHFDGSRSLEEIHAAFAREDGPKISLDILKGLADSLDQHFLLESGRFEAEFRRQVEAFRKSPTRAAHHAGAVYPPSAEEARAQIEELLGKSSNGPAPAAPRALLAPHIDFSRGAETYGKSYAALRGLKDAEVFVILGTSHHPTANPLCLTKKNYGTPFGEAETDRGFVEALAAKLPGESFADEYLHRTEHSAEFQVHFLKHLFPKTPVVPILCGGLQNFMGGGKSPKDSPPVEKTVRALREVFSARKNAFLVLGVDLAHVGPRFGFPAELDAGYLRKVEEEDRLSLEHAARLDAEKFFRSVMDGGDPRKVCGLAPIYLGLRVLENAKGTLLDYRQCASEDQCVTIAGMIFS